MHVWSIRWAIFGISSEIWIPGTAVGIDRNGPPVGVPGLGSHVSNWLGAAGQPEQNDPLVIPLQLPGQHRAFSTSSTVMSAANAAAPAATEPRKPRRLRAWSGDPQNVPRRVSDMEFAPRACLLGWFLR